MPALIKLQMAKPLAIRSELINMIGAPRALFVSFTDDLPLHTRCQSQSLFWLCVFKFFYNIGLGVAAALASSAPSIPTRAVNKIWIESGTRHSKRLHGIGEDADATAATPVPGVLSGR
jgi:hypothetical protein